MTTGFAGMGAMTSFAPTFAPTTMGGSFMMPFGAMHCPVCGYSGPTWHGGASPSMLTGGGFGAPAMMGGLGGLRRFGGTYSPQYLTTGLPTDEEIEEMVYDTFDADPLVPWDVDIDVESSAGVVTLRGEVPNKTVKHAIGDDTWWVPGVDDVRNELVVTGRRRVRAAAPAERPAAAQPPARRPAAAAPTARAAAPRGGVAMRGRVGAPPTRATTAARARGGPAGQTGAGGTTQTA